MQPDYRIPSVPSVENVSQQNVGPNLNQPKSFTQRNEEVRTTCSEPKKIVQNFLDQDAQVSNLYVKNKHNLSSLALFGFGLGLFSLLVPLVVGMGASAAFGMFPVTAALAAFTGASIFLSISVITLAIMLSRCNTWNANSMINKEQGISPSQKRMLKQQPHACNKNTNVLQMQILALKIKHDQNLSRDDKVCLLNRFAGKKVNSKDVEVLKKEYQQTKSRKTTPAPTPPISKPRKPVKTTPTLFEELQEKLEARAARLAQA